MMSQKYKNFVKGSDFALPPSVKRFGYLRKLKKMKRRFFVLHMESESGDARLEYYSSEKKWRAGSEPRRSIELKTCLNISRKLHSKQKNVIALYTQDDCFSVVTETPEELELWLCDLLQVQRTYLSADENKYRPIFEHLWQVEIDKHDLECSPNLAGPYRVALSSKSLTLIKMNPSNEFDYLEFPLMSIRRCGHSKDHFFIELGRSAVTGAGEIYMATEGTIIAQNMHETVLSAMKSSKVREDGNPLPRPRSASTSENCNPVATRRPIGVVAPQTLSTASSNTLSNSRERCDSLPTRPKTLTENPHNCIFNALSSPHSGSGISCRRISSRPHSMYEWPSFNSPSTRITSPFSFSSNGGYASSSEEVDSIKQSSSFYSQAKCSDVTLCSDRPITEVPDEYLMMSPSEESKNESTGYMVMKQSENMSDPVNYMDMKSAKAESNTEKKPDSYMPMAPGGAKEENPVSMQDGYLDMSPSTKSYLKNFNDINSLERSKSKLPLNHSVKAEEYFLEKVPSLLKVSDEDKRKIEPLKDRNSSSNALEENLTLHPITDVRTRSNDIPFQPTFSKENENFCMKPPLPKRTYKNERNHVGPPLPARRSEYQTNSLNSEQHSKPKHNKNEIIPEGQMEENSVFEDQEVFSKSNLLINKDSSADPNTNVSYFNQNVGSINTLTPVCSAHPILLKQSCKTSEQNQNHPVLNNSDCANSSLQTVTVNQNSLSKSEKNAAHSFGDYVNLEFKKSGGLNTSNCISNKNIQLIPNPPVDSNYSNIHFGKPFCPTPNPVPATCEPSFSCSTKVEKSLLPSINNNSIFEDIRNCSTDLSVILPGKMRNIPNTLPAFRKQMSAPAASPSLRPDLPSPGRKSSCPVTGSASMIKPPLPTTTVRPVLYLQGSTSGHLRISTSRSPDHSSVSSISSASDEISSNHSSPKISHSFGASQCHTVPYENVVIPQRPPSVSSEKELNYASLDLAPSIRDELPTSVEPVDTLLYAEIDFTKSEGLKNISGTIREGRL